MKFSIKDFFSKRDQIRKKLRIWSHLLKKSLKENFVFRAVFDDRIILNILLYFDFKNLRNYSQIRLFQFSQPFFLEYAAHIQYTLYWWFCH